MTEILQCHLQGKFLTEILKYGLRDVNGTQKY